MAVPPVFELPEVVAEVSAGLLGEEEEPVVLHRLPAHAWVRARDVV